MNSPSQEQTFQKVSLLNTMQTSCHGILSPLSTSIMDLYILLVNLTMKLINADMLLFKLRDHALIINARE